MKAKSSKAKGSRLEKHLVDVLRETVDKDTHRTAGSGSGLDKNDVRIPSLNIEIEAKNANSFNIQGDWEQVERQLTTGNIGVLAVRHPKKPEFEQVLIVMDLDDWIDLLMNQSGTRSVVEQLDPKLRYKLINLSNLCKEIAKEFER